MYKTFKNTILNQTSSLASFIIYTFCLLFIVTRFSTLKILTQNFKQTHFMIFKHSYNYRASTSATIYFLKTSIVFYFDQLFKL